jgi:tetratricopeptide (TPR) repeat protein
MRALAVSSFIGIVVAVMLGSAATQAREPTPTEKVLNEAREHARLGNKFYDLGRWDEAIAEFEKAYELRNDPAFLFTVS